MSLIKSLLLSTLSLTLTSYSYATELENHVLTGEDKNSTKLDNLPHEMLSQIFKNLSSSDLMNLKLANSSLYYNILEYSKYLSFKKKIEINGDVSEAMNSFKLHTYSNNGFSKNLNVESIGVIPEKWTVKFHNSFHILKEQDNQGQSVHEFDYKIPLCIL